MVPKICMRKAQTMATIETHQPSSASIGAAGLGRRGSFLESAAGAAGAGVAAGFLVCYLIWGGATETNAWVQKIIKITGVGRGAYKILRGELFLVWLCFQAERSHGELKRRFATVWRRRIEIANAALYVWNFNLQRWRETTSGGAHLRLAGAVRFAMP